jgi:5'-3' exonuclease
MSIERIPKGNDICLIDGDSLLYYEMDKPTLEEAVAGLDQRIYHMLNSCNTSSFAGFLTKGQCFRYNVDPLYKAKRKDSRSSRPIIFPALVEYLIQRWRFTYISELEADDLVAYYAYNTERKTIICSPDKDVLYQCVGMHYNYRTTEFVHTSPGVALWFLWKQVLMGDSTDNIPGLRGVGEKTAENWLKDRTKDFEAFTIKKYVEQFGMTEGIFKFNQTFRLVYLLKTPQDVIREFGSNIIPELVVHNIETISNNTQSDDEW